MQYMAEAVLIVHSKALHGRWIVQRKIWALPEAGAERPHGLKYSLFCGDAEHCLVRYDNEAGKGDSTACSAATPSIAWCATTTRQARATIATTAIAKSRTPSLRWKSCSKTFRPT